MRLGACGGNRFRIMLRRTQGGKSAVAAALRTLRMSGFINYYGLQRFGTNAARNDEVGLCCLHWRYEDHIFTIFRNNAKL